MKKIPDAHRVVERVAAEVWRGVPPVLCALRHGVPHEFVLLVRDMGLDREGFRAKVKQALADLRLGVSAKVCARRYGMSYEYARLLRDNFTAEGQEPQVAAAAAATAAAAAAEEWPPRRGAAAWSSKVHARIRRRR